MAVFGGTADIFTVVDMEGCDLVFAKIAVKLFDDTIEIIRINKKYEQEVCSELTSREIVQMDVNTLFDEENRKISLSIRALLEPVAQEETPAEEAAEEATDNE